MNPTLIASSSPQVTSTAVTTAPAGLRSALVPALFAVALFAATAPLTQLALTQLSPMLVSAARALLAGIGALICIRLNRWPLPPKPLWLPLLLTGVMVGFGFPWLLAISLQSHSAAETGLWLAGLPLLTSILAVVVFGERVQKRFWFWASLSFGLLLWVIAPADPLSDNAAVPAMIGTLVCGGVGYTLGAWLSRSLGGWQTICWALVVILPFSALSTGIAIGQQPAPADGYQWSVLLSVVYLALISQWWGFRFWYGALSRGTARMAQVQILQPLFTLILVAMLPDSLLPGSATTPGLWLLAVLTMLTVAMTLRTRQ
ncbi:DMT family transporter [Thalassolituus sp. LLYu03]|uniref:DMT family transporter n=1 Tax=Thalassolituus sp. LLYu03 TaxID=3421656 RepID=UPI003D2CF533